MLDASTCNETNTSGCTKFAPATVVGAAPVGIDANPNTKTVYVANQTDNTLSVIDTSVCNKAHPNDCNQVWTTIAVGSAPRSLAINRVTNTIYVPQRDDGTVSVINGDHCNGMDTSGCDQSWPTVAVGASPQALTVNPNNHTVYVANTDDNTSP